MWRLPKDRSGYQAGSRQDGGWLMRPFAFERAADVPHACRMASGTGQGQTDSAMQFLAGGTTLIDLMKLDVLRPRTIIDLGALSAREPVSVGPDGLTLSAFAKMSKVAAHPAVLPTIR
jgi:xanthine dehydrogenase YagS FAD-binding subunit